MLAWPKFSSTLVAPSTTSRLRQVEDVFSRLKEAEESVAKAGVGIFFLFAGKFCWRIQEMMIGVGNLDIYMGIPVYFQVFSYIFRRGYHE